MKLTDSPKDSRLFLKLVEMVRPDQASNFSKAGDWFEENFVKQFGSVEVDELRDIINKKLAFHEGPITISTIFNWVKIGLQQNKAKQIKSQEVSQIGYYD